MPYTIRITPRETEVAQAAQVEGIAGNTITYEPAASMEIIGAINAAALMDSDLEQPAMRLTGRIATLYGQLIARKPKTPEKAPKTKRPKPVAEEIVEEVGVEPVVFDEGGVDIDATATGEAAISSEKNSDEAEGP